MMTERNTKSPNKSPEPTPVGAGSSAARSTVFDPAWLSFGSLGHIERVMKFSNGTEFRFATPKYSHVWGRLLNVGGALVLLSFVPKPPLQDWIRDIAWPLILVGLVIALVGSDWNAVEIIMVGVCLAALIVIPFQLVRYFREKRP